MTAPDERRVLLLASSFPPGPQVILRSLKFAEFLPRFGWTPTVLTAAQHEGASTTRVPPGVDVHRAWRLPAPSIWARNLSRPATLTADQAAVATATGPPKLSTLQLRARQLLLWIDTPDSFVGWLPFALVRGLVLVRRLKIDVIHASGPPFSVALCGAMLARLTGRPLVLDFRDTWTLDASDPFGTLSGGFRGGSPPSRLSLLRRLEAWCLRQAAATLFTSRTTLREYAKAYPERAPRMSLIFNGADPLDFKAPLDSHEALTLTHVGTIHDYQAQQVQTFLEAFATARAERRIPDGTRVVFVGPIGGALRTKLGRVLDGLGLKSAAVIEGTSSHETAVSWMRRSRLLLLFAGSNQYIRLSKMSEYLASGRPVLAFASAESETGVEAREHGWSLVTENTPARALEGLVRAVSDSDRPSTPPDLTHPHPLNRLTEAEEFGAVLDRLVARLQPERA